MRATLNCIVVKYTHTGAGWQWDCKKINNCKSHKQASTLYVLYSHCCWAGTGTSEFFVSPHVLVRVVPG